MMNVTFINRCRGGYCEKSASPILSLTEVSTDATELFSPPPGASVLKIVTPTSTTPAVSTTNSVVVAPASHRAARVSLANSMVTHAPSASRVGEW